MKVTVIGMGKMGSAFAQRLFATGHEVILTDKNMDEAKKVAAAISPNIRFEPPERAAAGSEIIIAATPYSEQVNALRSLGSLKGKVVIDICNPLTADRAGLVIGHSTSAAEEIAKKFPDAKVVKAFNTIFAQVLKEGPRLEGGKQVPVFYAGDDDPAKQKVRQLIEDMGFDPVDSGPLSNARNLEPMGMQNIWFGYMAKQGTQIAPAWLHH